ncbi:MAG TPA: hypothetical protein VF172_02875 [Nitrososphaera sp.]
MEKTNSVHREGHGKCVLRKAEDPAGKPEKESKGEKKKDEYHDDCRAKMRSQDFKTSVKCVSCSNGS